MVNKALSGQLDEFPCRNVKKIQQILACLAPNTWIEDTVIKMYFELVEKRSDEEPTNYPRVWSLPPAVTASIETFGISDDECIAADDFFDNDILLVPFHKQGHWVLVVVHVEKRVIEYYDSLGRKG